MQNPEVRNAGATGAGISWRRLAWVVPLAAVVAAVANAIVYVVASGFGFIPQSVLVPTPGGESPLTVGMVAFASVIGAIGAAVVFAVIGMFSRRPVRSFGIVATAVVVLSFASPLTIPDAPVAMVLSMELMHVVAWAAIVGLFTTLARRLRA